MTPLLVQVVSEEYNKAATSVCFTLQIGNSELDPPNSTKWSKLLILELGSINKDSLAPKNTASKLKSLTLFHNAGTLITNLGLKSFILINKAL